jgi:hypothetical protein
LSDGKIDSAREQNFHAFPANYSMIKSTGGRCEIRHKALAGSPTSKTKLSQFRLENPPDWSPRLFGQIFE